MIGKYNDERYRINEEQEEEREIAGMQDNMKGRRVIKILEWKNGEKNECRRK
jgi:hypothetical protein